MSNTTRHQFRLRDHSFTRHKAMGVQQPTAWLPTILASVVAVFSVILLGLCGSQVDPASRWNTVLYDPCNPSRPNCLGPGFCLPQSSFANFCVNTLWYPGVSVGVTAGCIGLAASLTTLSFLLLSWCSKPLVKWISLGLLACAAIFGLATGIILAITAPGMNTSSFCSNFRTSVCSYYNVLCAASAFGFLLLVISCVSFTFLLKNKE